MSRTAAPSGPVPVWLRPGASARRLAPAAWLTSVKTRSLVSDPITKPPSRVPQPMTALRQPPPSGTSSASAPSASASACPACSTGWCRPATATRSARRQCILLWMNGGPSTIDLWDLKPGHDNGGPYKEIKTNAPGLMIGEHLPEVAKFGDRMAVLRGMSTKEGDHGRATYLMRTGSLPVGGVQFPSIGGLFSKELGDPKAELPNAVSIAPQRFFNNDAFGPGFLGPNYAPLMIGDNIFQQDGQTFDVEKILKVQNLDRPADVSKDHADARLELLRHAVRLRRHPPRQHLHRPHRRRMTAATRLMQSDAGKVFDLSQEKETHPGQVRPQPVRPGVPARPPADREGRGVRRGEPGQLGHARRQLHRRHAAVRHARQSVGRAHGRPEGPRAARQHAHRLDGRVRPHAEDQRRRRAATTSRTRGVRCWPAAG